MNACEKSICVYPDCECKRGISKRRAALSHQYRKGLRLLLIDRLEVAAKKRGLSKSAVANQVGLVGSQYSRVIHGGGDAVSIDSLLLFLERLGVRVELLFSDLTAKDVPKEAAQWTR